MSDPTGARSELEALIAKWRADADRSKLLQGLDCANELESWLASRPAVPQEPPIVDHGFAAHPKGMKCSICDAVPQEPEAQRPPVPPHTLDEQIAMFGEAQASRAAAPQGKPCVPDEPHCAGIGSTHHDADGNERCDFCGCLIHVRGTGAQEPTT